DVVVEVGAVERKTVAQAALVEDRNAAPQTRLEGARHHLLQVRVADEEIGEAAGIGRPGAGELGGGRRAIGNGGAAINRKPGRGLVGRAGGRIEVTEVVCATAVAA